MDASRAAGVALEDRLRGAGLRATRPRVLVYGELAHAGGHHSADDVVALLAARGHALPRMSVYNVLRDLVDAGLAMQAVVGPGRAVYEVGSTWHHHFVCRRCADVIDVPCARGTQPCLRPPRGLRAQVDEAQVIYRGLCPKCLGTQNRRRVGRPR